MKKLTCGKAVEQVMIEISGVAEAKEIFSRVKKYERWSDDTIWQHLMSLVVNLPPAYHHWSPTKKRFLFLREDGHYELHDPKRHGRYSWGTRTSSP